MTRPRLFLHSVGQTQRHGSGHYWGSAHNYIFTHVIKCSWTASLKSFVGGCGLFFIKPLFFLWWQLYFAVLNLLSAPSLLKKVSHNITNCVEIHSDATKTSHIVIYSFSRGQKYLTKCIFLQKPDSGALWVNSIERQWMLASLISSDEVHFLTWNTRECDLFIQLSLHGQTMIERTDLNAAILHVPFFSPPNIYFIRCDLKSWMRQNSSLKSSQSPHIQLGKQVAASEDQTLRWNPQTFVALFTFDRCKWCDQLFSHLTETKSFMPKSNKALKWLQSELKISITMFSGFSLNLNKTL